MRKKLDKRENCHFLSLLKFCPIFALLAHIGLSSTKKNRELLNLNQMLSFVAAIMLIKLTRARIANWLRVLLTIIARCFQLVGRALKKLKYVL